MRVIGKQREERLILLPGGELSLGARGSALGCSELGARSSFLGAREEAVANGKGKNGTAENAENTEKDGLNLGVLGGKNPLPGATPR